MLRLLALAVAALVTIWHGATSASAQTYPTRTVKFILPFGPASGTDITARLVTAPLAARWGKPVVIENRPGGDGLVAINAFTSANDDHTLLWVPVGTFAVHPYQHDKLPYDAERDLVPIVNVSSLFLALSAPAALNVGSFKRVRRSGARQSGQVQRRRRQRQFRFPDVGLPEKQQHADGEGALSRHHAGAERPCREPHPAFVVVARDRDAADARGQGQGAGGDGPPACGERTRCADRQGGRLSGAGNGKHRRHLRAARHAARTAQDASPQMSARRP